MMSRQSFVLENFSGGLDLVSSLNDIKPGFTPHAKNFRISEYGGIEKVRGYSAFATLGSSAHDLTVYANADGSTRLLVAAVPTGLISVDSGGTATTRLNTWAAASNTSFAMHADKLYALDTANNIAVWDGAAASATTYAPGANTGPPQGIILGIWEGRMWVAKTDSMRVEWSEPADATNGFVNTSGLWPTANNVELGGTGSTSDTIIGGMVTPDGLLVFTTGSTYLIYDSTDGFNSVVDAENGCSSRRSLARVGDAIFGVNARGIFATTGRTPLEVVSGKVDPLFQAEDPDLTTAAGARNFRSYLLSYDRGSEHLMLDVSPEQGSIMAHDYPAYAFATGSFPDADEATYFIDATDRTKLRLAFDGGTFAGTDIECRYETPFMDFGDDRILKRMRRVRLVGFGDVYVAARVDYSPSATPASSAAAGFPASNGMLWGTGTWGTGQWGGYELSEAVLPLSARGRRLQLVITETSDNVFPMRTALGLAPESDLGGAGVYLLEPQFTLSSRRR
jgi:hypothetical protein